MLQIRSIVDVADNSGAKRAATIGVIGRNQRYAFIGDVIKAHVKEASPDGTVKKGDVVDAVIVRTRKAIRRSDGSYLRFDTNAIVLPSADHSGLNSFDDGIATTSRCSVPSAFMT